MALKFDPTRVAVVDSHPDRQSTLVRGMSPATSGTFDYDALGRALIKRGVDIAGKRLVVISVIDNVGERWAWAPEVKAFGVDPDQYSATEWPPYVHRRDWDPGLAIGDGQWISGPRTGPGDFYWWPFEGLPENTDPKVFLSSPGWDFSGTVDLVASLFAQATKTVVYFHCMLGADRTGALHTAYLMKRKGLSLAAASKVADNATSAKGPNADYQRLREAYAKMLGK